MPTYLLPLSLLFKGMPVQIETDSFKENRRLSDPPGFLGTPSSTTVLSQEPFTPVLRSVRAVPGANGTARGFGIPLPLLQFTHRDPKYVPPPSGVVY
jgi:hypothetical protein